MKKKLFVEDLVEGREIDERFAVRTKTPPKEYAKGFFFRLTVGDKTGDVSVVYWGGLDEKEVTARYESIDVSDVVEVKGIVSSYRDRMQISVNQDDFHSIKKLEREEFDAEDFIPKTKKDIDEMTKELITFAETIDDEDLSSLVFSFLNDNDFMDAFKGAPYSKMYNNNYIGGLLEHTLDDVKMSSHTCEVYPELDRDLLISAAVLHDFGKVYEYETTTSIELTTDARMIGHTVLCERVIREKIAGMVDFPDELSMKLSHIILSHHGDYEWGSARSPRMEEAVALHHIDLMNVRLRGFIQAKEELTESDEEMIYVTKEGVKRPIFTR